MGLSKSNRIIILLVVDTAFFFLELIVGYAVHSLALVADAFHMLNDVLSLIVGLWAVKVANTKSSSAMYTYGWQRAETLGALFNGVFLIALCLSIFLEAIQRFVEPQIVTNPKLVLIVGCLGLASNILGLLLFHDHGHSHGAAEPQPPSKGVLSDLEEGLAGQSGPTESSPVSDNGSKATQALPEVAHTRAASEGRRIRASDSKDASSPAQDMINPHASWGHRRHRTSGSFGRGFGSVDHILSHPVVRRREIIEASQLNEESDQDEDSAVHEDSDPPSPDEQTTLLKHSDVADITRAGSPSATHRKGASKDHRHDSWHTEHHHTDHQDSSKGKGGHGHSHGDLNMQGIFLHVLGDFLGNIGVVVSALFIWLTTYKWRYYLDPAISLLITVIILLSAIPLCKAASRILLQAVPIHLDVTRIKQDIEDLPGIISCHHLHVWQLSDTKIVASLHIQVDCEVEGAGSAGYMHLARQVRRCLHDFGIHSSTIQPEFCFPAPEGQSTSISGSTVPGDGASPPIGPVGKGSKATSVLSEPGACLLDCGDECGGKDQCCPLVGAKK